MSGETDPGSVSPSPARGIAALVAANTSLLIAVLVYMGWAYEDALYGYFQVRPLDLDVSVVEYILRSLTLFSPAIVIAAVVLISVTAARTWGIGQTTFGQRVVSVAKARISAIPVFKRLVPPSVTQERRPANTLLIAVGAGVTVTALVLAWIAHFAQVNTYVLLCLLGGGPLLLTWPTRADHHGRFPYAMAIVVSAVCAMWGASLYAHNLGVQAAQGVVRDLSARTAVVVYSVQPLALSGPGVTVQRLPAIFRYHYRYEGLRLLLTRSGTYYFLPVHWSRQLDLTYVFSESSDIRIELLGAQ